MIRQLATDLWVATHKLRFYGTPVVTRMTIARLADGGLVVHSPVPRTAEMEREVLALGPLRWVVAPNRFHHLWAGEWAGIPGARLLGAPGLPRKRKDLRFDAVLGAATPEEWEGQIDQLILGGIPILGEAVFCHRASRTLIVTDLFFNYRRAKSALVRLVRVLEDCDGKFTVPRLIRLAARDRRSLARSVDTILSWDFDRIVLAHGDVVDGGGHAIAERAVRPLV